VRGSGGDGMICFSCEDNGIGFDPAAVRTQPDGERGLGLASMEERVNLLQGSFELDSIPGQGTRISVTLPLDNEQL
jgi:signal transduction histidine kinase